MESRKVALTDMPTFMSGRRPPRPLRAGAFMRLVLVPKSFSTLCYAFVQLSYHNMYDSKCGAIRGTGRIAFTCRAVMPSDRQSTPPVAINSDVETTSKEVSSFARELLASLQPIGPLKARSFCSLSIQGPSKRKQMEEKHALRGHLWRASGRLFRDKSQSDKLQMTFKYHGATDMVKNWHLDDVHDLMLDLLSPNGPRSAVPPSEWQLSPDAPGAPLGLQLALLTTSQGTYTLDISRKAPRLRFDGADECADSTPPTVDGHDRAKDVAIDPAAPFLQALGLTDASGKVKPKRQDKMKQIQKFVEIVGQRVDESWISSKQNDGLQVVDMGCGRGYLTFALHSFLRCKFPDMPLYCRGIDVRPKLVGETNAIARSLGSTFDGLSFETGTIGDSITGGKVDILIALHACDTATDDAIWAGIQHGAAMIVLAPCCHKEIRPQLDRCLLASLSSRSSNHPLADILRHRIYRERAAETVTDSLRALLLELAGYRTQVFEFVGGEHTSKNVMISASKRKSPIGNDELDDLQIRIRELCELHGIQSQKLAMHMFKGTAIDAGSKTHLNGKRIPLL